MIVIEYLRYIKDSECGMRLFSLDTLRAAVSGIA